MAGENKKFWPKQEEVTETTLNMRKVHTHDTQENTEWWVLTYHSSWSKLLRIIAYALKYIARLKEKVKAKKKNRKPAEITKFIIAEDIKEASLRIVKNMQEWHFSKEIRSLKRGDNVDKTSPLKNLNPFLDNEKILRIGGRNENSTLTYAQKHSMILPKNSVTRAIILQCHLNCLHGGPQLTLNLIRQRFQIIDTRNLVRSCVKNCVPCQRTKAQMQTQKMADLVIERSRPSRPFFTKE